MNTTNTTVVRNSLGLAIAGTRITLYDVVDYLKADWPPKLIQQWLNLTEQQIKDVLEYIEKNRPEVEAEYQSVLQHADEVRQYWENRNQERFAKNATLPPQPGQEKIRAKLQAWKAKLQQV